MRTHLLPLLFATSLLHAAEGEKPVTSRITAAKVFLSGAQVTRTAAATVVTGRSTLVFTGLSQELDPLSLQVTGRGGYTVLSVNHRINYLSESPQGKEIADLQAAIRKLEHDWNIENGLQQVWVTEEQLLLKNSAVGGAQNGITAVQLQAVNDYVRERMKAMKAGWLAQEERKQAIHVEAEKLRQQLAALQAQAPRPTSEVVVEIDSPADVNATFTIAYVVPGAGWTPAYDLRAKAVGQPIELLMKARVFNNTGEDWTRVQLDLSSGNPTLGGLMPQLQPWVLERPYAVVDIMERVGSRKLQMAPSMMDAEDVRGAVKGEEATTQVAHAVVHRTTTVEYAIATPFSVPSDGQPHMVGVRTDTLAAGYRHACTPKLDTDAFLFARTTGWEDLDLLPGEANVFFEGTFVGQSMLDLSRPTDTLEISLGRDKGVVVERVRRKGTDVKAVVGGKRTVTRGWDITVRNTKSTGVDLYLLDQYPLSPRSEVEVRLEEAGGAAVDDQRGLLTWHMDMEPKATRKVGFAYSVKHPKDEPVIVE